MLPSTNRVVNCAFFNNYRHKTGSDEVERNDVNFYATTGVTPIAANILDHCYYETATFVYTPIQTDNVTNVAPKFVAGNVKYPNAPYYMPRYASALRNAGKYLDWMEGAVDFAGNARVIDSVPDIGCYECNLQPCGVVMYFR